MFNLTFVDSAEISFEVSKILSENILYRPVNRGKYVSLILSSEVRKYKENLKYCCEVSEFYDFVTNLKEKYVNLAVKSLYEFLIPFTSYFTKQGDLSKNDVTNMVKSVEDTILGEVIDDRYVIESMVRKSPILDSSSYITVSFEFYQFNPVEICQSQSYIKLFSLTS